jgi:hypothetical protein
MFLASLSNLFVLQDVLAGQQAVIQNLVDYISHFNTGLLHRVGVLEVGPTLLHDN